MHVSQRFMWNPSLEYVVYVVHMRAVVIHHGEAGAWRKSLAKGKRFSSHGIFHLSISHLPSDLLVLPISSLQAPFFLHVPPAVHLLPPNLPSIAQGSLLTALMHGELTGEYRSCFCDPRVWISALLAHPHDPHGLPRSSGVAGYYLIVREPLKLTPGSRCFSLCHHLEGK